MKTQLCCFLSVLGLFMVYSCEKQEYLSMDPVIIQLNPIGEKLVNSNSDFGIDLFKETINSESGYENLMISPFSVSLALAMTYNGANGDTKTAMENALHLGELSTDEININFSQLSEALLNLDPSVNFSIANSIWYRSDFSVLQDFILLNQSFYKAEVNKLNFADPGAKDVINKWVAENTNNKIPKIIDVIDSQTMMFLINAIYFKGLWKYKFDKSKNFSSNFYLSDGTTKQVEMMQQWAKLSSYSNNIFSMVQLPFGRGNWAMDLILPKNETSLKTVINEMTASSWNNWTSMIGEPSEIQISIPPFKFEYEKTLNEILSKMGMSVAFDPNLADFSKINNENQLYISKVIHKTYIEVNEDGSEAAAATSVGMSTTSIGDGLIFNRPFLFLIRELSTGTVLFIGKVENPER